MAWSTGRVVALGQAVSLLITGTGVFSTLLAREGVDAPTTQSLLNYALLAAVFGVPRLRRLSRQPLLAPWHWYAAVAVADVEANYLVVRAYQYTTITSVMLLDCFTIPACMALSLRFLGAQYSGRHLAGVCVCVLGLAVLVASDSRDQDAPPDALLGDLLCVAGAVLYATSNVMQEALVKRFDRAEFLGMLGVFGTLLSAAQLLAFERHEAASLAAGGSPAALLSLAGFVACLFAMYALTSLFLQLGDSALFNLSLLTSDLFAVVTGALLFQEDITWGYYVAFPVVVAGLVVYNRAGSTSSGGDGGAPAGGSACGGAPAGGGSPGGVAYQPVDDP